MTFSAVGDEVKFIASAPTTGWVAVGFSNDMFMVR